MSECPGARRFNRTSWLELLRRLNLAPESTTDSYQDGNNVRRFKGSAGLKKSQVYPPKFGREVPVLVIYRKKWKIVFGICKSLLSFLYHPNLPYAPLFAQVARQFDLHAQQHGLDVDPRREEIDYSSDPWEDARKPSWMVYIHQKTLIFSGSNHCHGKLYNRCCDLHNSSNCNGFLTRMSEVEDYLCTMLTRKRFHELRNLLI